MSTALLKKAAMLPVPDRIKLVEDIWDSIADETNEFALSEAQKRELDRRLDEMRRNPKNGIPWEQAKLQILKRK